MIFSALKKLFTRGLKEDLGWPPMLLPESRTRIKTKDQEAYFLPGARAIKERAGLNVSLLPPA